MSCWMWPGQQGWNLQDKIRNFTRDCMTILKATLKEKICTLPEIETVELVSILIRGMEDVLLSGLRSVEFLSGL